MAQISYFWESTVTGDATAAPYSSDEFSDFIGIINHYDRTTDGVILTRHTSYSSQLEVTCPAGATARVANGAALVDGKLYLNTANVDSTVSGNAVYWVIGLVKNFAAQTVRVFARGNYATRALAMASLQQNDGVDWEIALATVLTTAGGAVSAIRDERVFIPARGQMVLIEHYVVPTGGSEVDFQSIPQYFSHLKIVATAKHFYVPPVNPGGGFVYIKLNNDGGANYNTGYAAWFDLSTVSPDYDGDYALGQTIGQVAWTPFSLAAQITPGMFEIDIPNYTNTTFRKTVQSKSSNPSEVALYERFDMFMTGWESTDAISRVTLSVLDPVAGTYFAAGSIFDLYGIF